jgi:hypothetical protein
MNNSVKNDIIHVLDKAINHLITCNIPSKDNLSALSNMTIHNASIFQDEDSITIAVIIYSLSKIVSRYSIDDKIIEKMKNAKKSLEESNFKDYNFEIKSLLQHLKDIDSKLKYYIQEVITNAKIKKGGKLYDHGISLSRASHLLGISQWELMSYVGKTKILDKNNDDDKIIKERVDYTKKIFLIE